MFLRLICLIFLSGCWAGVTASAGPRIGYTFDRGVSYGWAVSAGTYANGALVIGAGTELAVGQVWRPAAPLAPQPSSAPIADVPVARERITFLQGGVNYTAVLGDGGFPLVQQNVFFGPAWSNQRNVALSIAFGTQITAGPAITQPGCGAETSKVVPTFVASFGAQVDNGVWEIFFSPRAGAAYVSVPGSPCFD